jgi:predicted DNA binding CopG/RHH family protein
VKVQRPEGMTDKEKAAWMESDEGRRFLDEAEWKPVRFVPKDPSLLPVTIRLPADLPNRLRRLAGGRGMGYQTLARQWLLERCAEEEANEQRNVATRRRPRRAKRKQKGESADKAAG